GMVGRLAANPKLKAVSTYPSEEIAGDAISEALASWSPRIQAWLASGQKAFEDKYAFSYNVGVSLVRGQDTLTPTSNILVTLERDPTSALGYYIVRSYPVLKGVTAP